MKCVNVAMKQAMKTMNRRSGEGSSSAAEETAQPDRAGAGRGGGNVYYQYYTSYPRATTQGAGVQWGGNGGVGQQWPGMLPNNPNPFPDFH